MESRHWDAIWYEFTVWIWACGIILLGVLRWLCNMLPSSGCCMLNCYLGCCLILVVMACSRNSMCIFHIKCWMQLINLEQAERLKSCKRRTKVNRLDGQWARWLIGLLDRIGLMVKLVPIDKWWCYICFLNQW